MMGRQSAGSGVGRGNGAGSMKTRFKDGAPSGNPKGRPRKPRPRSRSLADALATALTEMVVVTDNGVKKKVSQSDAMAMVLLAEYPKATTYGKIAILRLIHGIAPSAGEKAWQPSPESVEQFVTTMAAEFNLERDERGNFYDPNDPIDARLKRPS